MQLVIPAPASENPLWAEGSRRFEHRLSEENPNLFFLWVDTQTITYFSLKAIFQQDIFVPQGES